MTQEDKELLLKDLCARLPYGVKYMKYSWNYDTDQELPIIETLECVDRDSYINHRRVYTVGDIKPYLFPLSSMSEEQKKEMKSFDPFKTDEVKTLGDWAVRLVEFYNKHHLDYHGLIPKGLANDATGLNIY